MSLQETDIGKMKFWVPRLWERDWATAIENAEEPEKPLLETQFQATQLLSRVTNSQVTFARLAWLNLWVKVFTILDAAGCAARCRSLFLLRLLARTSFENSLHAQIIIEPFQKLKAFSEEPNDVKRNRQINKEVPESVSL